MNLKQRADRLKKIFPQSFWRSKQKKTPLAAKISAGLTVAYALSPIDLIPDFIPVLGYLDDVILLPALVALTVKLIPQEIFNKCRTESENMWENGRPKNGILPCP